MAQETLPRRLPRARAHNMTHATRGERGAPENASWRVLGHGGHPEDTGISFLSPGQAQGAVSCGDTVCQDTRGLGVSSQDTRCSQDTVTPRCAPQDTVPSVSHDANLRFQTGFTVACGVLNFSHTFI